MAQDAVHNINGHEPVSLTSRSSFETASAQPANDMLPHYNSYPQQNKIVFFVGSNVAAHQSLRHAVQNLADMGIPCQIFLTDVRVKNDKMREKLSRPEVRNMGFFDKLMINHGYPIMESHPLLLDAHGDLHNDLQYTPRQLEQYYTQKGVQVKVEYIDNINDPAFIERIQKDQTIARAYNIRNMQIMSPDLIATFEDRVLDDGLKCQIINTHPADVKKYPGTNTAFYARMDGMTRNIWTFHVIDKGIDTGPIIYTISSALKPGKTLMQDLCSMSKMAGDAISNDAMMVLNDHVMRAAKPQMIKSAEDRKYYTYAEHDEYLEAAKRGIVDVNPHTFVPAIADSYCGQYDASLKQELHHRLAAETLDWQMQYMDMYVEEYGHFPPQFNEKDPTSFFISVPLKPRVIMPFCQNSASCGQLYNPEI